MGFSTELDKSGGGGGSRSADEDDDDEEDGGWDVRTSGLDESGTETFVRSSIRGRSSNLHSTNVLIVSFICWISSLLIQPRSRRETKRPAETDNKIRRM